MEVYNNIEMYRGDTFIMDMPIYLSREDFVLDIKYDIEEGDKLYIGLREPNKYFEQSILKQVYTINSDRNEEGDIVIRFDPEETEHLLPGLYYLCGKLMRPSKLLGGVDTVNTVLRDTMFYIL